MMNLFLFLAAVFAVTFIIGRIIEKFRVPWIFGALILGFFLAIKNPFSLITSSPQFEFMASIGLYLLLFVIGFEIDLKKIFGEGKFIINSTLSIILLEALFGGLVLHYIFNYDWVVSIIVALSFATVGEAILIPILDEFKLIGTSLGRAIIGIGILDDGLEILALVLAVLLIGSQQKTHIDLFVVLVSLLTIFILAITFRYFRKEGERFKLFDVETLFLFAIFILFFFIGIGSYAEATSLGALLAGVSLKTFLPKKRYKTIETTIKSICYGLFAPLFFLDVGLKMNINYLITYPLLILIVIGVVSLAKISSAYLVARKRFGTKKSVLLGIGLLVRFSTSIVIVKLLFDNGIITNGLFSVLIASSILFGFVVPFLFSHLLVRWKIAKVH